MEQAAAQRQIAAEGVIAEIDRRLEQLERELEGYEQLRSEQRRLRRARRSLTGEGARRISAQEVAAYLERHPGARVSDIASALGVAPNTISAHLRRGRGIRFSRGASGWSLGENRCTSC